MLNAAVFIDPADALEALFSAHSTHARTLYATIIALVLAAAGAAAVTRVDVTVRVPGTLVPAVERQTLRSLADGIVDGMRARVGSHVGVGDTLLTLAAGAEERAGTATRSSLTYQQARVDDLRALIRTPLDTSDSRAPYPLPRLESSRARRREAEVEWRQASVLVERDERARDRLKALGRRGFAVPSELESAEFDVSYAREERALALERKRAAWSEELADATQQVLNLERDAASRANDRSMLRVLAPVSGTIEQLMALSTGSVVRAGDPIGIISPDATLETDALVSPRDVVLLHVGMPARLTIDGYDLQEWGGVDAVVTSVASDYVVTDGHPVFRVRLRPVSTTLQRPGGARATLGKGLRCQVRFILGRRLLVDFLRRRTAAWMDA